jgi:hypothetical protein
MVLIFIDVQIIALKMYVHDNKIHFVGDFFAAFHKCCRSLTNTVYESKVVCIIGIFFFYLGNHNNIIQLLTGSEDNSCSRNQSITDLLYLIIFNAFYFNFLSCF